MAATTTTMIGMVRVPMSSDGDGGRDSVGGECDGVESSRIKETAERFDLSFRCVDRRMRKGTPISDGSALGSTATTATEEVCSGGAYVPQQERTRTMSRRAGEIGFRRKESGWGVGR